MIVFLPILNYFSKKLRITIIDIFRQNALDSLKILVIFFIEIQ
jgi:hypothetical protein